MSFFSPLDRFEMENDLSGTAVPNSRLFDIRRQVTELDATLGGVTVTSTAIETREIEIQELNGQEILALGGLRLEARYRGFCREGTNVREGDNITPDSGTTDYQVVFVEGLFSEHIEFLAKRID